MTAGGADATSGHLPVLYAQVLDGLRVHGDGRYLDGTFGRGGHAGGVLERLGPDGRLLVMDKDPDAIAVAEHRFGDDARVSIRRGSFAELAHWEAATAAPLLHADPKYKAVRERHARGAAGGEGVGRHPGGEGVRRVHHRVDPLRGQVGAQALDAAEAADPDGNRLFGGNVCAPGEGEDGREIGARREPGRETPCLSRSAQ